MVSNSFSASAIFWIRPNSIRVDNGNQEYLALLWTFLTFKWNTKMDNWMFCPVELRQSNDICRSYSHSSRFLGSVNTIRFDVLVFLCLRWIAYVIIHLFCFILLSLSLSFTMSTEPLAIGLGSFHCVTFLSRDWSRLYVLRAKMCFFFFDCNNFNFLFFSLRSH